MANIKKMQMWDTICADARVSVGKSLFGLRTTAVYNPTGSVIDARIVEFSPTEGERLKHILLSPADKLVKAAAAYRPRPTVNGNIVAQLCQSRDGAFVAVQLLQFTHLSYEPVTEVLLFEGAPAAVVIQLF